jgi:hypothetical protein
VFNKYLVHPISNLYGLKYEYWIKDAWASTLSQGIFLYLIGIKLKSAINAHGISRQEALRKMFHPFAGMVSRMG